VRFLVTTAGADSAIAVHGIGRKRKGAHGSKPTLGCAAFVPDSFILSSALLAVNLESLVNAFRNGKGSLIQNRPKHADIR
jgi:hypothetical protein